MWTGEICHAASSDDIITSEGEASVVSPPKTISLGGNEEVQGTQRKTVFVTRTDQLRLERQLRENEIRILPVWLADENGTDTGGIKLHDQSRWRRYANTIYVLCFIIGSTHLASRTLKARDGQIIVE